MELSKTAAAAEEQRDEQQQLLRAAEQAEKKSRGTLQSMQGSKSHHSVRKGG